MNYTKNYHLPQWEETDRVLMEDFNQMCMNLEDALSRMAPSVQAADHMSRDLYRQAVQQRLRHGVDDRTDSMWLNSLTTRADAGGEGHGWNGRYGVAWGSWALPTVEGIKATATELCWANGSDPTPAKRIATLEFTSDGYGTLENIGVWFWQVGSTSTGTFPYTITMTRIDTGAVVGQAGPFTSLSTYGGSFVPTAVRIGLPLEAQVTYRLSFSVSTDVGFNGRAGFIMNSAQYKGGATPMTFTQRAAEHSILKSVTAPAWAERAFGLIRWRGSGEVILSVNGTPLEQERTSDSLNADGAACLETEFSLTSLPAGALTATLEMRPTGDMEIYDYGLIWR